MKSLAHRSSLLVLTILLPVVPCAAQKQRAAEFSTKQKVNETIARLSALVGETQTLKPAVRFHLQAQSANLLWNFDRVFARNVFLKAWASAEVADHEAGEKQEHTDGSSSTTGQLRDARREVISTAWQKDPALGQELLAKMVKHDEQGDEETANNSARPPVNELSTADLERLNIATQLLNNGDVTQAIKFAADVLNRVAIPSLRFLSQLRERNPAAADELYVSLLARVATDPAADANTVSLMSSYVLSPNVYVTVANNGSQRRVEFRGEAPPIEVSAAVRLMFLNTAAQLLLRPTSDPTAQLRSYLVAIQLLPVYGRFNPELAKQIDLRIRELSSLVPDNWRYYESFHYSSDPAANESAQDMLERVRLVTNLNRKYQLYIRAAILAAEHGDHIATQAVDEIDSGELREQVRPYVFMLLARNALLKKDLEGALEFGRNDALSPVERVWIYTQAVDLMKSNAAIDLLLQALAIARRIDAADPNKARALTAIASQLRRRNHQLADPYLIEAVVAANKADSFDAEDALLTIQLETVVGDWSTTYEAKNFCLKNLFRELAKDDFLQAINISENLESKEVRSVATLAIAEIVLTNVNHRAGK